MKVQNLIKQLYEAIRAGQAQAQRKIYEKITRKSLRHKRTQAVQ